MIEKSIESFDSTRIVYQVGGKGDRWLVVANGYGGSFWAWTDLFSHLQDKYRLLIWDYRGFYKSGTPKDRDRLRIEDNCRDLDCLMEAEGVERMVLAGWSVGVQVALEHYRRRPESVDALLLINGSHGRPLHRSGDGRLSALIMPNIIGPWSRLMTVLGPVALPPLRLVARSSMPMKIFDKLGLVASAPESMETALQSVLTLDWSTYLYMASLADEHDTEDLLPSVAVPTLVTAGDKDIITTPRVARHIAEQIPGAEYFEVPGATHYVVLEFPQLMAERMDNFIRAHLG